MRVFRACSGLVGKGVQAKLVSMALGASIIKEELGLSD